MAKTASKSRRWNGFVCPECRFVFRVPGDHAGEGVVCPSCRILLRLAGQDEEPPLLKLAEPPKPVVNEVVYDNQTHHQVDPNAPIVERRRRRNVKKQDEIFDETFAKKDEVSSGLVKGLIGSIVMGATILAVVLLWPKKPEPAAPMVAPLPTADEEAVVFKVEEPDAEELAAADQVLPAALLREELQPVIEAFLGAESVEEMAEWVRHPEETLPRMERFYADGFSSVPFREVAQEAGHFKDGDLATVGIRDQEFTDAFITLSNSDGWKVDWENWVGWSDTAWEDFTSERSQEVHEFRARIIEMDYYNFDFVDEAKWRSYRLASPDYETVIYGYVERGSELDSQLLPEEEGIDLQYFLKLRFPPQASTANQVLIDGVINPGWVDLRDK